jgi:hypothetical protein
MASALVFFLIKITVSCRLDYGESNTKNRIILSPRPVEEIVFIGWLEKWWRRQEIFTVNKISISYWLFDLNLI